MKIYDTAARKRPVNLTLNEDLVDQTRKITGNLSGVVESLLADYLAQEKQRHAAQTEVAKATVLVWTNFAESHGSFADEHSTL
jgi:antitoxin CcdA